MFSLEIGLRGQAHRIMQAHQLKLTLVQNLIKQHQRED
jgi:hypothetical protein